ncbi:hypothetical protein F511_34049 [Dorcoceras hygrometricum]|uniref:Uncharacterized protein n=1 Tax=Dorcoceras hygrometricum TaxID=472368 RepID=A0A2Z7BAP9_9LAMI|nr:hypothetical protein F511_34049 [Dorcoceras hygrometricum]
MDDNNQQFATLETAMVRHYADSHQKLIDELALLKSQLAALVERIKEFGADKKGERGQSRPGEGSSGGPSRGQSRLGEGSSGGPSGIRGRGLSLRGGRGSSSRSGRGQIKEAMIPLVLATDLDSRNGFSLRWSKSVC